MRHILTSIAFSLALLSAAWAADHGPIMVYPTPKAESAPTLDGKLDDPCWEAPPLVSGFTFFGKPDKLTDIQTHFRVSYDDQALYLAVTCDEPEMTKLKKSGPGSRDGHSAVFRDECIELFVDPFHDHANYYQIALSVQETIYDGCRTDTTWNSDTRVATRLAPKAWFMEVALPWANVGIKRVKPGMVVGLNVCRDRNVQQKQWTNWSPVTRGFHNAPLFGHLVLSPTTKMLGALTAELRKGDRQGQLRVFSSEGFTGAAYLEMGRGALAELDRVLADLESLCAREPAAVAKNLRERIAATHTAVKPFRDKLAASKAIDSAEWIHLDRALVKERQNAAKSLWDVRLKTLLDEI